MNRRSKNKENESPEVIKKSSTAHYSDTGIKIKINNPNLHKRNLGLFVIKAYRYFFFKFEIQSKFVACEEPKPNQKWLFCLRK